MNKYSVIVFDLGNVLIPFDYTPFIKSLNDLRGGLGDRMIQLYKSNYNIHRSFEAGKISEKEFLAQMMEWTEGATDEENFCRIFSDIFTVNGDVVSLLPLLKEKYMLVLLSNTNSIHKKYGWEKYGFLKYFDKLCLSNEIGAVKPEEKIYKAVEEFTGHAPAEHIFIDDVAEYAEGARRAGWDAIHFKVAAQLKEELAARNII